MTRRGIARISTLTAIFILALAVPAGAQTSPTTDAYGGPQSQVLGDVVGGGPQGDIVPPPTGPATEQVPDTRDTAPVERGADAPVPTPSVASGELPFTGLEAGLVALFGALLVGTGFAMRRASRSVA